MSNPAIPQFAVDAVDRAIKETSIPDCAAFLRAERAGVEHQVRAEVEKWKTQYPDANEEQVLANAAALASSLAWQWYRSQPLRGVRR